MSPQITLVLEHFQVNLTFKVQERWNLGAMEVGQTTPPQQPDRKGDLTVLQPGKIKRGKGGTQVDMTGTCIMLPYTVGAAHNNLASLKTIYSPIETTNYY